VLDRVLYDNYESMTTLAAAAAVTERITLAATIVIAPLRATAVLAKQALTVNALSGGRFILGLGLGARRDDYDVSGALFRGRGAHLTDQIVEMLSIWEGSQIGPSHGSRPRLLLGGGGGSAASRMARYADGFVHNGGPARVFARAAREARAAWEDLGRSGAPQLWGMAYFELCGDDARGSDYLRDYYAFTGPFADRIAAGLLTSRQSILDFAREYEEAGCDELVLFPAVAALGQLDRLSEAVAAWQPSA
jgi:alkanesulfonate monooxygenase SsuD/methylene tetrahydromethanopterin reductase-like flavin-dependent oxidoreductase (luciferase family)